MGKIKKNFMDNHVSFVYEDICIEEMWRLKAEGAWDFHFDKVGRWWDGKTEIDIVALDNSGNNIIFGECKYWKEKVGANVLIALEEKAKGLRWRENCNKHFVLFAINGFTDELIHLAENRDDVLLLD